MNNFLRIFMVLGDAVSKLEIFCMDLEPCFKVHNLIVIKHYQTWSND